MTPAPSLVRVITWLPVGGIERRLVSVLPRLAAKGWRVSVALIRERGPLADELEKSGVPIRVIPFPSRLSPSKTRELAGYLREREADVLHSHMYRANAPGTVAARLAKTRATFAQIHNVDTWETPRQAIVDRLLSRYRTNIIAVSEAVKRDIVRRLHVPEEKVVVLHNGIDTDTFRPDAELRAATRGALGIAPDTLLVLIPARLHPQKNPLGMLSAFQHVVRGRTGMGKAVLAFAGKGDAEPELRAAIASAGLQNEVMLLGERSDMPALYNAADLIALPSIKEGFSNAVLEALACGRPVLATDVGGNREAITEKAHGWIIPPGDGPALENALWAALEEGAKLADRSSECRAQGMRFGLDELVEKTHRLYCGALTIDP